jgi:glutamate formiminotransferase
MFECVINVAEGRDEAILQELERAAGSSLRDRHSDEYHHRSVFTLINDADALVADVRRFLSATLNTLDLAHHRGVHPRLGVADVIPFVALAPATLEQAVVLRDATGAWLADQWHLPVFFYGPLAEGERTLPEVRRRAFRDLGPDLGPTDPDPHRGAACVGARPLLLAWNLWLEGVSLERTREIARDVRGPGVRTLGLEVGAFTQVSCNLVDLEVARPSEVYDAVRERVPSGALVRAELVGLAPRAVVEREDPSRWAQLGLSLDATIESRLARG